MQGFPFRTALMLNQTGLVTRKWNDDIHLEARPHGEGIRLVVLQGDNNIMAKTFDDVKQCEKFMMQYGLPGCGWSINQEETRVA